MRLTSAFCPLLLDEPEHRLARPLPTFVQLDVTATEPGVDGDTAAGNVTEKATVETGAVIHVPLFVRVGDTAKIDTRTHEYVERVEHLGS